MNPRLTALVVDDSPVMRTLLSAYLQQMGHHALAAESGEQAIEIFEKSPPDLVLMDVMMPGMGGYKAAARLKEISGERWMPVMFVTADDRDEAFVRGLTAGGDYYLTKPVHFASLQAQILAIQRTLQLHHDIETKRQQLEAYRLASEREREVASGLMRKIVNADLLNDPALQWWLAPAEQFSGDLIACARSPQGKLHLILADGTGHGLAAAVNVMPIVEPFYAMTAKGFDLGMIAQELNQKTCSWLPVERFIAATLVAVDFGNASIEVWNGGNPPCIVLDGAGKLVHTFAPKHPALGVIGVQRFDTAIEVFHFSSPCQLIAYSDGAIMSRACAHQKTGVNGVLEALIDTAPEQRMERFKALVDAGDHEDDVTVMMVDCVPAHAARHADGIPGAPLASHPGVCSFNLTLGAEELQYLDPVSLALDFVQRLNVTRSHHAKLFLLLSELITNAIDHGLLKLDSAIKQEPDGLDRYLMLRGERLAGLTTGQIDLTLELIAREAKPALRVALADSGAGFDYRRQLAAPGAPDHAHPHGRGIALVKALCASLEYRATGNQVVAVYELSAPPGSALKTTEVAEDSRVCSFA